VVAAAEPAPPPPAPRQPPEVAPAQEMPPAFVQAPAPAPRAGKPLYRRWGFWAAAGAVVAGGAATAILLGQRKSPTSPTGDLGAIDWR
jgi:hypothetical protein